MWQCLCCLTPQMHIDSHEALGVLNTLFEIVAPSSLRPVDMLLRSMFVTPSTMVSLTRCTHPIHSDLSALVCVVELNNCFFHPLS
jgi:hypothetical protein